MGIPKNALFWRWRRHRFLLLQNRHTVLPVHKHRAQTLMYFAYTPVLRAGLPCPHQKITIFRDTHRCRNIT